jgi:hypothetical protein
MDTDEHRYARRTGIDRTIAAAGYEDHEMTKARNNGTGQKITVQNPRDSPSAKSKKVQAKKSGAKKWTESRPGGILCDSHLFAPDFFALSFLVSVLMRSDDIVPQGSPSSPICFIFQLDIRSSCAYCTSYIAH